MSTQNVLWFMLGLMAAVAALLIVMPVWSSARVRFGRAAGIGLAAGAGIVAIAAALSLYYLWGRPHAASEPSVAAVPADHQSIGAAGSAGPAGSMEAVTAKLAARLKEKGGTAADWQLLAQSYNQLGNTTAAAVAQAKANELGGTTDAVSAAMAAKSAVVVAPALAAKQLAVLDRAEQLRRKRDYAGAIALYKQATVKNAMNANAWASYADALASSRKGQLQGEPATYIDRALALDPNHGKALWLKASALTEAKQFAAAIPIWRKLQSLMAADSPDAKIIAANLAEAESLSGAADNPAAISGEVDVDPRLRNKVAAGMTLFVFAKSPSMPGPPLAVLRVPADRWPVKFSLDDSNAMVPGRTISSAPAVKVEARLSQSGQALPQSGDLQGGSSLFDPKLHQSLRLVINQVVP